MGSRPLRWLCLLAAVGLLSLVLQGPVVSASPPSVDELVNLASAEGVRARATSSLSGYGPGQAIDGSATSAWRAASEGSLRVDFPGPRSLVEVHVHLQSYGMPRVDLALRDGAGTYRVVQSWDGSDGRDLVWRTKWDGTAHGLRISFPEPLRHTHSYTHRHCSSWSPYFFGFGPGLRSCYSHLHEYRDTHYARVAEVEAWGLEPDSDGDGLTDEQEAAGWEVAVTRFGTMTRRWVVSDPMQTDADEDGWTDRQERNAGTDPNAWDTDEDGLWDDEDPDPRVDDADGDGVADGLDKVPEGRASLAFRTRFPPGLVRFRQPVSVFSVEGQYAWVSQHNAFTGACQFRSDETAAATRSSAVDGAAVLTEIRRTFQEGGEEDYAPTRAAPLYEQGTTYHHFTYGGCDFWSPKQYRIGYAVPEDKWAVDFVNVREVKVPDGFGGTFHHALETVPVRKGHPASLVFQYTLPSAADRTAYEDVAHFEVAAFGYSVYRGDPMRTAPLYENTAVAAGLEGHAYRVEVKIPGSVTARAPGTDGSGQLTVQIIPAWVEVQPGDLVKRAFDPGKATWASLSLGVPLYAYQVIPRLHVDLERLEGYLPEDFEEWPTGRYVFGPYDVYVHNVDGGAFPDGILGQMDAVVLVALSEVDLLSARENIEWGAPGTWYTQQEDAFGTLIKWFKGAQSTGGLTLLFLRFADIRSLRLGGAIDLPQLPSNAAGRNVRLEVVAVAEGAAVRYNAYLLRPSVRTVRFPGYTQLHEIVETRALGSYQSLDDVPYLSGRHIHLKAAMKGLGIGVVLVTVGRQGVLAFLDGNAITGSLYVGATSTAVLSMVFRDVPLRDLGMRGIVGRLSSTSLLVTATGGILASHALFRSMSAQDSISRLSYLEQGSAIVVDTGLALIPAYGIAVLGSWTLTVAALSVLLPNRVASQVVSSPGSSVTFALEYVFSGTIPSAISEDAFTQTAEWAIYQMQQWSGVYHIPSIVILPQTDG